MTASDHEQAERIKMIVTAFYSSNAEDQRKGREALDALAAQLAEAQRAQEQLADLRRQMEELREQGLWPVSKVAAQLAERERVIERLESVAAANKRLNEWYGEAKRQLAEAQEEIVKLRREK